MNEDDRSEKLGAGPGLADRRRDLVEKEPAEGVSEFARHGDPSLAQQPLSRSGTEKVRSEIVWIRPTELVPSVTGRVAGQGLDLESSLVRRTRALPIQGVAASHHAIRERALRLPPVTAFGNGRGARGAVRRSGLDR